MSFTSFYLNIYYCHYALDLLWSASLAQILSAQFSYSLLVYFCCLMFLFVSDLSLSMIFYFVRYQSVCDICFIRSQSFIDVCFMRSQSFSDVCFMRSQSFSDICFIRSQSFIVSTGSIRWILWFSVRYAAAAAARREIFGVNALRGKQQQLGSPILQDIFSGG